MTQTVVAAAMGFGQSSEVFVPMAMARGHRRADIEVVVGYQPVWCIYPTIRPFVRREPISKSCEITQADNLNRRRRLSRKAQ